MAVQLQLWSPHPHPVPCGRARKRAECCSVQQTGSEGAGQPVCVPPGPRRPHRHHNIFPADRRADVQGPHWPCRVLYHLLCG